MHTAKLNMPRKKAVKKSRKKNHDEVLRRDASDNVRVLYLILLISSKKDSLIAETYKNKYRVKMCGLSVFSCFK